ncbi:hypothetical protein [Acerihabitans arboris]|uniref:Uncharacterized protein n=1 Tax=Acerihabitans arboris TaxID=2691583 RepID=A0A845SN76_9GAMM|nr:hypothetical protein [Acerihabitans arboris]NDL64842.1 hypothetical protein [Acerihabitans arboris]
MGQINCAVSTVTPWTYGAAQVADSGRYLSPPNAMAYLAKKLAQTGGTQQTVIFLLTGTQLNEFTQSISDLAAVFPHPDFTKLARRAAAQAKLDSEKMLLPGAQSQALSSAAPLAVSTARQAVSAQRIKQAVTAAAGGISLSDLGTALSQLQSTAAAASQAAADSLADLAGRRVDLWVFSDKGALSNVANAIQTGVPNPAAIYTMATLFVGELDPLLEMLT